MADPKPLDFGLGNDPEMMDLRQKKAMEAALIAATMRAQGGNFRKRPGAVIADLISLQRGRRSLDNISAQEKALMLRAQQEDQSGMQELLQGMGPRSVPQAGPLPESGEALPDIQQPGDPRAAILKALTSRGPQTRGLGQQLYKSNEEAYKSLQTNFKDQLDPQSAIQSAATQNIPGLRVAPPVGPPTLQSFPSPAGGKPVQALQVPQGGGKPPTYQMVREPAKTEINNNLTNKPGTKALESQAEFFSPGGKGYEKLESYQKRMTGTEHMLETLMKQPQLGAGADGFQFVRKWAEVLGAPGLATTGSTDLMKSQLLASMIEELGGLGNQVSERDAKLMEQAVGQLGTDPNALRHILLLRAKTLMKLQNKLSMDRDRLANHPSMVDMQVPIPSYDFKFRMPEQLVPEFDDLMAGKPLPLRPLKPGAAAASDLPPGMRRVQ